MYMSDLPPGRLEEFCIISLLQTAVLVRDYDHASRMSKKVFMAIERKRVNRRQGSGSGN